MDVILGSERAQAQTTGAEQRVRQLLALNKAAIAITSELELHSLLQRIVDSARELVGCKYAALGVLGSDGFIQYFPTSGISETEREQIGELPRGHGLLGVMLRAGRSLRILDMSKDPRRSGFPPNHPPMTSLLGVPIFKRGKLVGDLYLTDKYGGPEFSEEDEWLVQLLAIHAATALINAELHEEAQRGRKAAEQEQHRLRELENMKDEFLSTAAHELRTPLTTILMSAGLAYERLQALAETEGLDKRLVDLVGLVVEGGERMQSLVNDLLDLTRLEQGRTPLNIENLDLREVARASVGATTPLFESKGQLVTLRLPEVYCGTRGDRQRLEQVLINLLSNANKYSPVGSPVEIRVLRTGKECLALVRDNGPGVEQSESEAIFERFYRSNRHRNDRTSSTGLGLPIARKIAEMHRGRLWVDPAPCGGSIFTLALPVPEE